MDYKKYIDDSKFYASKIKFYSENKSRQNLWTNYVKELAKYASEHVSSNRRAAVIKEYAEILYLFKINYTDSTELRKVADRLVLIAYKVKGASPSTSNTKAYGTIGAIAAIATGLYMIFKRS